MRHIQKKYGVQIAGVADKLISIGTKFNTSDRASINLAKKSDLYLTTDKGYAIKSFLYPNNGENLIIPIPDLSVVYFDSAYHLNHLRKIEQQELNKKARTLNKELSENSINEIYRYYGYSSSCLISLYTAMESFINHILPDGKNYEKVCVNKTEIYTKSQIQKGLSFEEKIRKVLPYFYEKDYFKNSTTNTQHIYNLKELRDEIVHPKSEKNLTSQEALIKRLLKFDYEKTMEAVASFMNFYHPDFIVECDCGVDF